MTTWTKLTRDGLVATISADEVDAFGQSADFGDAVDETLAQTADAVRGFVRAGGRKVPNDAGLVPPSLVPFAYDFATFRVLKRFNVPVGEDRRKAYDAAMDVFKKVAAGDMAVEPADDAEDATSSTLPSFVPANPERRLG